jgi:hypothetical protein
MPHPESEHFKGKTVPEHLKEARTKGMLVSAEVHGIELSGQQGAFADALRDTSLAMALLSLIAFWMLPKTEAFVFTLLFLFGWTIWKTCRSALLGRARLERLHRVIEEERWEIEHHRQQEREELMEIYQAKGFEGDLLTQVLDVLMADNNRLLQVMLTEELGLSLEAYDHPLKQAFGAFVGALLATGCGVLAYLLLPAHGFFIAAAPLFLAGGIWTAKLEDIPLLPSVVWNLSLFCLTTGLIYFTKRFFS